jgi:hypothetical protein
MYDEFMCVETPEDGAPFTFEAVHSTKPNHLSARSGFELYSFAASRNMSGK